MCKTCTVHPAIQSHSQFNNSPLSFFQHYTLLIEAEAVSGERDDSQLRQRDTARLFLSFCKKFHWLTQKILLKTNTDYHRLITNLPLMEKQASLQDYLHALKYPPRSCRNNSTSDQRRMPMASLLIAQCSWKLLLSGFVCTGNYNKLSA